MPSPHMIAPILADGFVLDCTDKIRALQRRSGCVDVQLGIVLLDLKAALTTEQYRIWCAEHFPKHHQRQRLEKLALRFHDVDPALLEQFSSTALDLAAAQNYPEDCVHLLMAIAAEGRRVERSTVLQFAPSPPKPPKVKRSVPPVQETEEFIYRPGAFRSGEFNQPDLLLALLNGLESRLLTLLEFGLDCWEFIAAIDPQSLPPEYAAERDRLECERQEQHIEWPEQPVLDMLTRKDLVALRAQFCPEYQERSPLSTITKARRVSNG
jgi:hypothetical protein